MSGTDDDTELRDLLIQSLDANGVLGKIKAELRASVFLAIDCLEAQDQSKNKSPLSNPKLKKFISENNGELCLDLILEFMQHFNLDYSSAVFVPETNSTGVLKNRQQLCAKLNLKESEVPSHLPLLACCLNSNDSKPSQNGNTRSSLSKKQLDKAKELFSASDRAQINAVSCPDAVKILSFLCPTFPVFLVDKFVSEEMSTSASTKITWNDFQCLYEKFYLACHSVVTNQDEIETSQFSSYQTPFNKSTTFQDEFQSNNEASKRSIDDVFSSKGNSSHIPKPTSTLNKDSSMDMDFDKFYDDVLKADDFTSPSKLPPPQSRSKLPRMEHKPSKLPSLSTNNTSWSSPQKADNKKSEESSEKQSMDYDDDFNTNTENTDDASITEDIQEESLMSSTPSSLAELTEDHSLSGKPNHADYMEDANTLHLT